MVRVNAPKLFTVEQANATLPLVRAVVRDIMELARSIRDRQAQGQAVSADEVEAARAREAMEQNLDRLRELEDELSALGVTMKDYFIGLVDFPSRHDGRIVYLCWKADEDSVSHWHELDAGFASRQKLYLENPPPASSGEITVADGNS